MAKSKHNNFQKNKVYIEKNSDSLVFSDKNNSTKIKVAINGALIKKKRKKLKRSIDSKPIKVDMPKITEKEPIIIQDIVLEPQPIIEIENIKEEPETIEQIQVQEEIVLIETLPEEVSEEIIVEEPIIETILTKEKVVKKQSKKKTKKNVVKKEKNKDEVEIICFFRNNKPTETISISKKEKLVKTKYIDKKEKTKKSKNKELKERIKEINKLNEPHKGPKTIEFHNSKNIIELKNVKKYYTNGHTYTEILKGVNLEIKRGDFVVILGPSGSGKTTLMNIISGLDRATEGVTNVCGSNLINLKDSELTKFRQINVGYVFQQYGLLPNLTVRENVEIGADLQTNKSKKLDLEKVLSSFGMLEHKNKFPHQLSGGQQQRVSIARAFAKNPVILFGDEPTGAIDEEMSKLVMKEFVKINKEYRTTVIIVTHNSIFERLGSLVIKFQNGSISSMYRNENPKSVDELAWG